MSGEGSGYCPDACTWPHEHRFRRDGIPWPARTTRPLPQPEPAAGDECDCECNCSGVKHHWASCTNRPAPVAAVPGLGDAAPVSDGQDGEGWRAWLGEIAGDETLSDLRVHDLVMAWAEEILNATAARHGLASLDDESNQTVNFGGGLRVETESQTAPAPAVVPQGEAVDEDYEPVEGIDYSIVTEAEANMFRRCHHTEDWLAARVRAAQQEARAEVIAALAVEANKPPHILSDSAQRVWMGGMDSAGRIVAGLAARADALSPTDGGGTDG